MSGFRLMGPLGHLAHGSSGSAVCVCGCVCPIMRNLNRSFPGRGGCEAWGAIQRWFLIAESALNFFSVNLF